MSSNPTQKDVVQQFFTDEMHKSVFVFDSGHHRHRGYGTNYRLRKAVNRPHGKNMGNPGHSISQNAW